MVQFTFPLPPHAQPPSACSAKLVVASALIGARHMLFSQRPGTEEVRVRGDVFRSPNQRVVASNSSSHMSHRIDSHKGIFFETKGQILECEAEAVVRDLHAAHIIARLRTYRLDKRKT